MKLTKIYKNSNLNLGEVYTPPKLSSFVSNFILYKYLKHLKNKKSLTILDPACGDGSLLTGITEEIKKNNLLDSFNQILVHGVDINHSSLKIAKENLVGNKNIKYEWFNMDSIIPEKNLPYIEGWKKNTNCKYDLILTNPPWGADLIHNKLNLQLAGYINTAGQIDSFYLFIEMCFELLKEDGMCIMILPDSIFGPEASEIRKYLLTKTNIKLISKLGEKIFPKINRATSLIMFQKTKNSLSEKTECFRLDSISKNDYLNDKISLNDVYKKNKHYISQNRFLNNKNFEFDIDILETDLCLVKKIEYSKIKWDDYFVYGRGVEVSKNGDVVRCNFCNKWQGVTKRQIQSGSKKCAHCNEELIISPETLDILVSKTNQQDYDSKFLVGENIHRYNISGNRFIKKNYLGINYKDDNIYSNPKLLIRKTGLGINSIIDYNKYMISQTIYYYILNNNEWFDLEYVLGVLNSRVLFYYYLKKYGENEWKTHPYLTHSIIKTLPIKNITPLNKEIAKKISNLVKIIIINGYNTDIDLKIEKLVMDLYNLNELERIDILNEINSLPNLGAINHMKLKIGDIINV
ncbi:N-6 DNA methylase [Cetobacterium somerae]|uniref:N-6 DNA methylase n=1 Tax=Cetobacterium somerae TaxID=188913 RepID=UPI003891E2C3